MKHVWVAAAVAPLAFAASLAHAQTVNGATTTPLQTATAGTGGTPSDITITANGAITLGTAAAPPTAVTINSNNTVSNAGAISATGINNAIGIQANGGNTGEIINTGTINITETDTSADTNSDGVIDTQNGVKGSFATGSGRYGILITGPGTFTGIADATNNAGGQTAVYAAGSISVIGENSTGVAILTSVTGDVLIAGGVTVTGGNLNLTTNQNSSDQSFGFHSTGVIGGNVVLTGAITATGGNAVGVAIDNGAKAITVSDSITSTGYRNTTPSTSFGLPTIGLIENTPAEMQQGGPAMWVGGTVTGGINVTAAVAATTSVAAVNAGSISSLGSAPALLIGNAANPTTIGTVSGDTSGAGFPTPTGPHGIVIGGAVTSSGVYNNVNATGIQIGGSYNNINGGAAINTLPVTVTGGISIVGSVSAAAFGNTIASLGGGNGSAIGLRIGAGAAVPIIDVTGSLTASSETNLTTNTSTVTALQIDSNAVGGTVINNNGIIAAAITPTDILSNNTVIAQGGYAGTATAILDSAGTVTSITNTNTISAVFSPANTTDVITGDAIAINLAANTAGVTVTQSAGTVVNSSGTSVATSPSITGDILFGSGAANLILKTGTLTGDVFYGASTGNTLTVAGGAITKGGLTVATGGALAINVSNGTLNVTNDSGQITVPTLNVGATGQIILSADPSGAEALKNGQLNVSTTAGSLTVASGASIGLNLLSALPAGAVAGSPDHFVIVLANGADTAQLGNFTLGATPYIYKSSLDTTYQPGALTIDVQRATAAQLNLNSNQAAAYNAIYNAFTNDTGVEADLLSKTNEASFKKLYNQFLPDFAGGPFESLAIGQRAIIRTQEAEPLKLETDQTRGWVQEIGFLTHQGDADSAGYDAGGFGVAAGAEEAHGNGVVGVSGSFLSTEVTDTGQSSYGHMAGSTLEAGVYWRSNGSGINANASLDGGYAWFDSQRNILDVGPNPASLNNPNVPATTATLQRTAEAQWGGGIIAAQFGLNAPIEFGHFYLRPEVSADYIALFEEGYTEKGGGSAFDLVVAPRTSQQASAQVDMVFGANFGDAIRYRPELMIGWRGVVYGGPGDTNARFVSGNTNFALNANFQDKGGLLGRLGLRAGGQFADFSADAGGEWHGSFDSYDARALARFLF